MASKFAGDKKVHYSSVFSRLEEKYLDRLVEYIPNWLETNHLTLFSIPWAILIVFFSYLAKDNLNWLWAVSLVICLQYLTDYFDGLVGRYRRTGLIKWGYYMDHFLDYVFLCAVFIGYMFLVSDSLRQPLFFILAVFIGFMMNSYLAFSTTNKFRISYYKIGPTEIRLIFIIVNALLVIFGTTHLSWILPYLIVLSLAALCLVVYQTQAEIWQIDMKAKSKIKN